MKTSVMKKIGAALTAVGLLSTPAFADKRLDDAVARAEDQIAKGKPDEALKTMQKAASQQPTSPEAQLALARIQQRAGSLDDAAASVAKAAQLATAGPVKAEALAAASTMDLMRGTGKDALAHAEQAVQAEASPAALAALARAQARAQGGAAALQTADKAVAAGASSADAHEARGEALLASGKNDEAVAEFRKALELDPKMNVARVRLASALLAQGQVTQAVAEARKATEADAKSAQAFAVLGLAILLSSIFGILNYLLIQLIILLVAGGAGVWLFYVQHQFEGVYWERGKDWSFVAAALQGSSFYKLPRILQWFSGNIGFHHIHHLSPRIPNYNLERCHKADPLFREIKPVTLFSSFKSFTFRLWDEKHRQLVSFRRLRKLHKQPTDHSRG